MVAEDQMMVLCSVSDISVDQVDLEEILKMLFNLDNNLVFLLRRLLRAKRK